MSINIFQFFVGCIALYYGAEFLVKGSKEIAIKFNISKVMVGITVVALGTSLPELFVSIIANIKNQQGMVIGNVMGSNIANIGLVLGITALILEIEFSFSKIRYDMYFFLGISFLPILFIVIGGLFLWQGITLILILIMYLFFLNHFYSHEISLEKYQFDNNRFLLIQVALGMVGLAFGAMFFVQGAKGIAIYLGVSDLVIGMSIVALGTSLPELAASLSSVRHGESGFVIGNVIGSNIMNIVFVLGTTLFIGAIPVDFNDIFIHSFFMALFTLGLFTLIKLKDRINKLSGLLLFITYLIFMYFNFSNS